MSIYTSGSVSPARTASATPSSERSFGSRQGLLGPLGVHDVHLGPLGVHDPHVAHATSDYGSSEGTHVQQCIRCLHYGHDRCRRKPRCFRCGSFEHVDSATCTLPVTCLNCGGPHHSRHVGCPSRLRELTIQQLVHKQGLSRKEAVQMAASFGVDTSITVPHRTKASSEKQITVSKSVGVQTDPPPADAATQTDPPNNFSAILASPISSQVVSCWGYPVYSCYPVQVVSLSGPSYPTENSTVSNMPIPAGLGASQLHHFNNNIISSSGGGASNLNNSCSNSSSPPSTNYFTSLTSYASF
ncbi:uncharacterized protein LOC111271754 [Varroa jacobsoni]|uniref:Uncharacterized protein n=1 Tax=Varroa destructor TaxID=109461 RepID=A0A7M7JTT6_VARDE|nr:uncharacterized protein LOC111248257 [Varroa destructor]XP_022656017.1 uncharacterized protein LOC111248257 [Varroa destructor]XP_022708469.1 uncharacterized protein LOC111271754 [Varroa jacobsoni]